MRENSMICKNNTPDGHGSRRGISSTAPPPVCTAPRIRQWPKLSHVSTCSTPSTQTGGGAVEDMQPDIDVGAPGGIVLLVPIDGVELNKDRGEGASAPPRRTRPPYAPCRAFRASLRPSNSPAYTTTPPAASVAVRGVIFTDHRRSGSRCRSRGPRIQCPGQSGAFRR